MFPKTRECLISEAIGEMLTASFEPVIELLAPVRAINPRLAEELECAVYAYSQECVEQAFAIGWQCAKQPELLIFEQKSKVQVTPA